MSLGQECSQALRVYIECALVTYPRISWLHARAYQFKGGDLRATVSVSLEVTHGQSFRVMGTFVNHVLS